MMRADTRLKNVQTRTEMWKVAATMGGIIVAAMGAGAGLLAGAIAFLRWRAGVG